jgi:hypothetical protein
VCLYAETRRCINVACPRFSGASRRIAPPGAESIEPQGARDASKRWGHPTPISPSAEMRQEELKLELTYLLRLLMCI